MKSLVEIKKIREIKKIIGPDNIHAPNINNFFNDLTNKMTTSDNIFWFIDSQKIMEQDQKNGYLWVSYIKIWSILKDQYSLNCEQIRGLIQSRVVIPYEMGSLTPILFVKSILFAGGNTI